MVKFISQGNICLQVDYTYFYVFIYEDYSYNDQVFNNKVFKLIFIATGYDSDSAVSDCSMSTFSSIYTTGTDNTYTPAIGYHDDDEDDLDSVSSTHTPSSLMSELDHLREATPLKDMSFRIRSWAKTGYFTHSTPGKAGI